MIRCQLTLVKRNFVDIQQVLLIYVAYDHNYVKSKSDVNFMTRIS